MKSNQKIYSINAIVIIIDIFTKLLVTTKLKENDLISIIPNFFSIYFVKNTGAAFSILQDSTIFLVILSALIIVVLDRFIKKEKNMPRLQELSFGLVMGGIFGNMIDRIINHSVTDFISFRIFNYNFPVFNISDIFINVSVIVIMFMLFRNYSKK